jgi:hypothetical protein
MKLLLISGAAAVLAGVGAQAADSGPGLAVCVQNGLPVNSFVMARAQAIVTSVFSEAGVRIEWLPARQCRNADANVFRLEMDAEVPARFGPEAMAYALPYGPSGTAIHIFCNRVIQTHRDLPGEVLGHVIAHEIGHVLEGIARHSADGLMKPRWDVRDYCKMRSGLLPFAGEDVVLMQLSLRRRSPAALTARSGME